QLAQGQAVAAARPVGGPVGAGTAPVLAARPALQVDLGQQGATTDLLAFEAGLEVVELRPAFGIVEDCCLDRLSQRGVVGAGLGSERDGEGSAKGGKGSFLTGHVRILLNSVTRTIHEDRRVLWKLVHPQQPAMAEACNRDGCRHRDRRTVSAPKIDGAVPMN